MDEEKRIAELMVTLRHQLGLLRNTANTLSSLGVVLRFMGPNSHCTLGTQLADRVEAYKQSVTRY